jgi:hypothetical protein
MRCGPRAELGGVEGLPLAAGAQDEEDGVHTDAIRGTWPAAAEAMGVDVPGQEELDLLPEVVGDAPVVGSRTVVHAYPCEPLSSERNQVQLHAEVIVPRGYSDRL